ncbi:MAG: hypothetical protein ABIT69_00430 [Sphingomicrobium sp.]
MRVPALMIAAFGLTGAAQAATPPALATPEAKALMAQCGAQKFETNAVVGEGSAKRVTMITLCAKPGENDAQWIATLHKAIDRVEDMSEISAESRAQVSAQLKAEIARLEADANKPAN